MTPILIAGPTASGKSALALKLARVLSGEIINADSGQLFVGLPILSAMPDFSQTPDVTHHLYGVLQYGEVPSAGWWRAQAMAVLKSLEERQKVPILVGGTGLYIRTLLQDSRDLPKIPSEIRQYTRSLFSHSERRTFWQKLLEIDPSAEKHLQPTDVQRMLRAFEVKIATGKSLFSWPNTLSGIQAFVVRCLPPREALNRSCNRRFETFLERGALEEVQNFLHSTPQDVQENVKTIGFCELRKHLLGEMAHEEALLLAQRRTRQYAKRQTTWFRHQLEASFVLQELVSEENIEKVAFQIGEAYASISC